MDTTEKILNEATSEQLEFFDYLAKKDWEGGYEELVRYGGYEIFPSALQEQANEFAKALDNLMSAEAELIAQLNLKNVDYADGQLALFD